MPEEPIAMRPPDGYGILVPCAPEEFVEFISKLLGKPQVAQGQFRGTFNIELADKENFYHLIDQRIEEQNKGQLVQFSSNIHYNNGTSVEVETLEGLKTYAEVRPLVSTGVMLTWVYLVKFSTQAVPEKQQIEVTFTTSQTKHTVAMPFPVPLEMTVEVNIISYRVSYTARTWGADIENLLKDHISSLIIPEGSSLRRFVRKARLYILNVIALAVYAVCLRVGIYVIGIVGKIEYTKYKVIATTGISQLELVTRKIDFLYSTIAGVTFASTAAVLFIYLGGTLILSYWGASEIMDKIESERPSFVILTRRSVHEREERLRRYEKNWQRFSGAFFVAVAAGVIGNIVTWFVWG